MQFVRFPLMAIVSRLKFKCDYESHAHSAPTRDLTTCARIYHDWLRAREFLLTLYHSFFLGKKAFYKLLRRFYSSRVAVQSTPSYSNYVNRIYSSDWKRWLSLTHRDNLNYAINFQNTLLKYNPISKNSNCMFDWYLFIFFFIISYKILKIS